jgi:hypothetical protein
MKKIMKYIRNEIRKLFLKKEETNDFYDYLNETTKYNNKIKKKTLTYPDLTKIKSHSDLIDSNDKELITM